MQRLFVSLLVCVVLSLAGCATPTETDSRPAQRPRIEPPQQGTNSLRLIIYRPQVLVGMSGRPVIVVNGQKMLTTLNESMLDPGSVFVVDTTADQTHVRWIQSGKTEPNADPLIFGGQPGAIRYMRWTLRPTYGFLEQVDENVARDEIGPLRYMGYRKIDGAENK